jgi:hypothetical protein
VSNASSMWITYVDMLCNPHDAIRMFLVGSLGYNEGTNIEMRVDVHWFELYFQDRDNSP